MPSWSDFKMEDESMLMKSTLDSMIEFVRKQGYKMQMQDDHMFLKLSDNKNYILNIQDSAKDKITIIITDLKGESVAQTTQGSVEWLELSIL